MLPAIPHFRGKFGRSAARGWLWWVVAGDEPPSRQGTVVAHPGVPVSPWAAGILGGGTAGSG